MWENRTNCTVSPNSSFSQTAQFECWQHWHHSLLKWQHKIFHSLKFTPERLELMISVLFSAISHQTVCKQDCIPVGCVPPACWPYLPACPVQGVSAPERGVSTLGRYLLLGGCLLPGGYPSMHWGRPPYTLWTEWQTGAKILPCSLHLWAVTIYPPMCFSVMLCYGSALCVSVLWNICILKQLTLHILFQ